MHTGFRAVDTDSLIQIPVLQLIGCVILSWLIHLSEPWFTYLQRRSNDPHKVFISCLIELRPVT